MKVQAAENFEKALELQEGYRDACEKLADYYREKYEDQYKRADFDTSIAYISRQIAVTENCYYLVHRGLIYMNAMELDEAIRDFEKALEYVPEDWAAHNNLGCCYKYLGRFEEPSDISRRPWNIWRTAKACFRTAIWPTATRRLGITGKRSNAIRRI